MPKPPKCPLCGDRKNDLFGHMNDCDAGTIVIVGERQQSEPIVTQDKFLEAIRRIKNDPDVEYDSERERNKLALTWLGYPYQVDADIGDGSTLED